MTISLMYIYIYIHIHTYIHPFMNQTDSISIFWYFSYCSIVILLRSHSEHVEWRRFNVVARRLSQQRKKRKANFARLVNKEWARLPPGSFLRPITSPAAHVKWHDNFNNDPVLLAVLLMDGRVFRSTSAVSNYPPVQNDRGVKVVVGFKPVAFGEDGYKFELKSLITVVISVHGDWSVDNQRNAWFPH